MSSRAIVWVSWDDPGENEEDDLWGYRRVVISSLKDLQTLKDIINDAAKEHEHIHVSVDFTTEIHPEWPSRANRAPPVPQDKD